MNVAEFQRRREVALAKGGIPVSCGCPKLSRNGRTSRFSRSLQLQLSSGSPGDLQKPAGPGSSARRLGCTSSPSSTLTLLGCMNDAQFFVCCKTQCGFRTSCDSFRPKAFFLGFIYIPSNYPPKVGVTISDQSATLHFGGKRFKHVDATWRQDLCRLPAFCEPSSCPADFRNLPRIFPGDDQHAGKSQDHRHLRHRGSAGEVA